MSKLRSTAVCERLHIRGALTTSVLVESSPGILSSEPSDCRAESRRHAPGQRQRIWKSLSLQTLRVLPRKKRRLCLISQALYRRDKWVEPSAHFFGRDENCLGPRTSQVEAEPIFSSSYLESIYVSWIESAKTCTRQSHARVLKTRQVALACFARLPRAVEQHIVVLLLSGLETGRKDLNRPFYIYRRDVWAPAISWNLTAVQLDVQKRSSII